MPSIPPGSASTGSGRTADALVQSQGSALVQSQGSALVQSQGSALAQSQGSASQAVPAQPSRAPLVAALVALAAVIGAGSFLALRPRAPQPQLVVATTVTATAAPTPAPTPTPTATEAVRNVDISLKRTKVVIVPSDAFVEVDGTRTPARGGLAEVNGVLGSAHRVRVWKGRQESVVEVKITEDGASPPKIELGASPPKQ
jgi:serine/threonine-protein kinase